MLVNPDLWDASPAGDGGGGATSTVAAELRNETELEGIGRNEEENHRNTAGNRWPREETLALLKIRSEMDLEFREATAKAPLWDEISRKLSEIGYHRCAKKCKEKFENIYKYHRRTKEGRSGGEMGKNYRYFEQLEVFDKHSSLASTYSDQIERPKAKVKMSKTNGSCQDSKIPSPTQSANLELMSTSTSSTSSSESESEGTVRKKTRMTYYFDRLMKGVLEKQENLQNKFLEAIEKYEKDRMAREEAWKAQEMARIKREQEILAHERAVAATKDAAVVAFLQKICGQEIQVPLTEMGPLTETTPVSVKQVDDLELLERNKDIKVHLTDREMEKDENDVGENWSQGSSSRWPKAEVEALVRLRSNYELQCQETGLKSLSWEHISSEMKKVGYDRSAKRCKEKWDNINKYYRRVKDSKRKRHEDSRTCPYFHLLESLYGNKSKVVEHSSDSSGCNLKPECILMQMIDQEKQQY